MTVIATATTTAAVHAIPTRTRHSRRSASGDLESREFGQSFSWF